MNRDGTSLIYIYMDANRISVGKALAWEQVDGFLHPDYFAPNHYLRRDVTTI